MGRGIDPRTGRGGAPQTRALAAALFGAVLLAGCETVQQTIEEAAVWPFAGDESADRTQGQDTSPQAAPAADKDPARVPDERVGRVQARLAELGYDPGPVDGLIGPKTRTAIRSFQADRGLAVDGEVNRSLLARLAEPPDPEAGAMALSPAAGTDLPAPSYALGSRYVYTSGEVRTVLAVDGPEVRWGSNRRGDVVAYDNFLLPPLAWSAPTSYGTRAYREAPGDLWPQEAGAEMGFSTTTVTRRGPQPENRSAVSETWRCRLDGAAQVTVAAGAFETRKIRCDGRLDPAGTQLQRTWHYAPEIRHYVLFEETGGTKPTEVREELLAIQPGTEDWPPVARAGLGWAFDHALETSPPGEATSWTSSAFDIQVATIPGPRPAGGRERTCRTFRQIWSGAGEARVYRGLACRAASGGWTIPGLGSDVRVATKTR